MIDAPFVAVVIFPFKEQYGVTKVSSGSHFVTLDL